MNSSRVAVIVSVVVVAVVVIAVGLTLGIMLTRTRHIWSFRSFDRAYRRLDNPVLIPRILFRTGPQPLHLAHPAILAALRKAQSDNPEYQIVYFDDTDQRHFISLYFPEYLPEYDVLLPGAYKADLWRLLVLYKYGGIYSDMGHLYLQPLADIVQPDDEFVAVTENLRPGIHNAFMAAYPAHPLIKHMIQFVVEMVRARSMGTDMLDITGPMRVGAAYRDYMGETDLADKPLWPGAYVQKGHKIRMHVINDTPPNDHTATIDNANGTPIIRRKFEGYGKAVYNNKRLPHYGIMYVEGKVYADKPVPAPVRTS